jgi:hypothetical protein
MATEFASNEQPDTAASPPSAPVLGGLVVTTHYNPQRGNRKELHAETPLSGYLARAWRDNDDRVEVAIGCQQHSALYWRTYGEDVMDEWIVSDDAEMPPLCSERGSCEACDRGRAILALVPGATVYSPDVEAAHRTALLAQLNHFLDRAGSEL